MGAWLQFGLFLSVSLACFLLHWREAVKSTAQPKITKNAQADQQALTPQQYAAALAEIAAQKKALADKEAALRQAMNAAIAQLQQSLAEPEAKA